MNIFTDPDVIKRKILAIEPDFFDLNDKGYFKGFERPLNKRLLKLLYRGKKRICLPRVGRDAFSRQLVWALTVKPGDYIGTCTGYNMQVANINYVWGDVGRWEHEKPNGNYFLYEVEFTSTTGYFHCCPGGGCAFPAETNEQITKFWLGVDDDVSAEWDPGWSATKKAIQAGEPFLDSHGEILPEFKKKYLDKARETTNEIRRTA